jgi:diguanylate cyclase (GGDEF)-like protein/PAS domain S-box-containing protein
VWDAPDGHAYRLLAEYLADVVLVTEDEQIIWTSPSARAVLGYDPEQLLGRMIATLVHPDDLTGLDVTPARPTMSIRARMLHADRSLRWFDAKVTARFSDSDEIEAVYHVLRDVEDQVRLQDQLDAGRRQQQDALNASPDGFAIYRADRDPAGMVTALRLAFINTVGAAGFAGDPAALIGQDLREFYPEAAGNGLWADLLTALSTGQPQVTQVQTVGDSWTGTLLGTQARLDADTVVSTWRDITDMVHDQQALAEAHVETARARATLQTALDATTDGFAVYDLVRSGGGAATGLALVHANTAALARPGLTPAAIVDRDRLDLTPGYEAVGLWDMILASLNAMQPRRHRVNVTDDTRRWVAAYDHTIAPVSPDRVVITVRDATADERAKRALEDNRRQAEHAATHDPLTDLPNRVLLRARLTEALAQCPQGELVGVIYCDLNDFKQVNDAYGHAAGDHVLRMVAQRLRSMLRPGDTAGRLSGDEFAIIMRGLRTGWNPQSYLGRLHDRLSQPVVTADTLLAPSASFGLYLADPHSRPDTDREPDTVLAAADRSMYIAKTGPRTNSDQ